MEREERAESVSVSLYTDVMTVNTCSKPHPQPQSENSDFKLLHWNFSSKFTTFICTQVCKHVVGSSSDFSSLEDTFSQNNQ